MRSKITSEPFTIETDLETVKALYKLTGNTCPSDYEEKGLTESERKAMTALFHDLKEAIGVEFQ